MKYERLTYRLPNGEVRMLDTKFNSLEALRKALIRLNELEDKIEDGTLVELPKIAYFIKQSTREIKKVKVTGIIYGVDSNEAWFDEKAIGDSVFFVGEEAEERLKEVKKAFIEDCKRNGFDCSGEDKE